LIIFPVGILSALFLFLKKHNNILSFYFYRFSSNCFLLYYMQRMMKILLLKIESSCQNHNKQKRLMSKLSCLSNDPNPGIPNFDDHPFV